MYRIYDRPEAIKRVQTYLALVGNPEIFVAPTGVFDDNTRLSVLDFQGERGLLQSGIVDYETFDILYSEYIIALERNELIRITDSFIDFPLLPGVMRDEMMHINSSLNRILEFYGYNASPRIDNFYSENTREAVKILREIYSLEQKDQIDEEFYLRMIKDHDSIGKFSDIF